MLAQNEKGKQVRDYYLILEKLWKRYMETEFKRQQQELIENEQTIAEITKKNSALELFKYNNARRWVFFKFKQGLCLYVIDSGEKYVDGKEIYKFGISGVSRKDDDECTGDVNNRLQSHRSLWPNLRIKLLIYTPHAIMLEKNLKHMNLNSEIIEIRFQDLSKRIFSILDILSTNGKEYELEDIEPYNKGISEPELTPNQQKRLDMYNDILDHLSGYTVLQITERLREFNLKIYGQNKSIISSRLKDYLEKCITSIREEDGIDDECDAKPEPKPEPIRKNYTIRDLVPSRLTKEQIIDVQRGHEDKRYCNAFCQALLSLENFHRNGTRGYHDLCAKCRSLCAIADKKIIKGELTPEQIKNNPWIIEPKLKTKSPDTKLCNECKQWKSTSDFDEKKCQCKDCRKEQARKRNIFDCEKFTADISGHDEPTRKAELNYVPKDRLVILMKFLDIKRSSSDRKASMIEKLVKYFSEK